MKTLFKRLLALTLCLTLGLGISSLVNADIRQILTTTLGNPISWSSSATGQLVQDSTNGGGLVIPLAGTAAKGVLLGVSTTNGDLLNSELLIQGTTGGISQLGLVQATNNTTGAIEYVYKSRAVDGSGDTIVQSGDTVWSQIFYAANGGNYSNLAKIVVTVDGTPGASADMPGAIDFQVSPDGSATPASALKLDNTKLATFGAGATFSGNITGQAGGMQYLQPNTTTFSVLAGGTSASVASGGYIAAYGAAHGNKASIVAQAGSAAGSNIALLVEASDGFVQFGTAATEKWRINAAGQFLSTTNVTNDIGWTLVSAANQACNTTCATGCVFGQETTSKALLACTDDTADICLCAGAT